MQRLHTFMDANGMEYLQQRLETLCKKRGRQARQAAGKSVTPAGVICLVTGLLYYYLIAPPDKWYFTWDKVCLLLFILMARHWCTNIKIRQILAVVSGMQALRLLYEIPALQKTTGLRLLLFSFLLLTLCLVMFKSTKVKRWAKK